MPCLGWPDFCLSWLVCRLMFAMRCDRDLCLAFRLYMFVLVCIGFCRRWLRQHVFDTLQICCGHCAKPTRILWECWRMFLQLLWFKSCKFRRPYLQENNSDCYDAFAAFTLILHLKAVFCYLHGQCAIVSFYDAYWSKRLRPSSRLCATWALPAHIAIIGKSAHTLCSLGFEIV